MRGDDRGEEFAGELVPKVVEEILHRAADAAVVVGRAEHNDIRLVDAGLELLVAGQVVRGVGVVKREGFLLKIKHIHGTAGRPQLPGDVMNDDARHRLALQAADDGQHV